MVKANPKDLISFKPKEVTKKLISVLSDRARDIIIKRYGLGKDSQPMTLESIGAEYDITRERVRQIENFALASIKKSPDFTAFAPAFTELAKIMNELGGIVHEQEFLSAIAKDESTKNHLHFLLVVGDAFTKIKEDDEFHHRWTTNSEFANKVHKSLKNLCSNLKEDDLIAETELVHSFLAELKEALTTFKGREQELAPRWLALSKVVGKNPLGEWGLAKSPNVHMRGIRDYAFLVLRHHGSPMHFAEVAKAIEELFGKKAHPATCHNELIKDNRFVLVGRGLYALTEWGYKPGVVIEVIKNIIEKEGPLTREEIVAKVLKERYVKENTILVNLQNATYFKRDNQGRYNLK